jgi:hypothetical protein
MLEAVARPRLVSVLLAALMVLGEVVAGQSMGEAARRERERRAKLPKKAVPSYTDSDLAARPGERTPAPSPSPSASPSGEQAAPIEDESAIRRRQETEWRARFEAARERVRQAEAAAWRTVVETVFVSGIPVQQHVRKFEETPELRAANKALADLEEEFRRTGHPPGWSR